MSLIRGPVSRRKLANLIVEYSIGKKVSRATADLPAATVQTPIFTITTGRILVRRLIGTVTTAIQNQACTLTIIGNPTTGSDVNLNAAVAAIAALEAGGQISIQGTSAATAAIKTNAGAINLNLTDECVPVGTIDVTCSATNTGQIKWDLWYIPLDEGASVVAA